MAICRVIGDGQLEASGAAACKRAGCILWTEWAIVGPEGAMEKSYVRDSCRFGIRTIGMTRKGVERANLRNEDFECLFAMAVQ